MGKKSSLMSRSKARLGISYTGSLLERANRCKENCSLWEVILVVTKLFNIAVNDIDAKKSTRCEWVILESELVVTAPRLISLIEEDQSNRSTCIE